LDIQHRAAEELQEEDIQNRAAEEE
jgi:hypothetical protein